MERNLKTKIIFWIHNILTLFVDYLAILSVKKRLDCTKNILIIRTDVIGDYVMFRNAFKAIKANPKWKDYSITFLGNKIYADFSEALDHEYIDEFIWIDRSAFFIGRKGHIFADIAYRFSIARRLASRNFEIALNSQFSRDYGICDSLIHSANAQHKIWWNGDGLGQTKSELAQSNSWYTELIDPSKKFEFEFFRNAEFFRESLNVSFPKKPIIEKYDTSLVPKEKFIILFPGTSGDPKRTWYYERFVHLSHKILEQENVTILLCGSKNDITACNNIKNLIKNPLVINLAGKTSLLQLTWLIKDTHLLISNDTSAIHIANCFETPTLCISNGQHYGRWVGQPEELFKNVYNIYPEKLEKLLQKQDKGIDGIKSHFRITSDLDINSISHERVLKIATRLL